jgi:uracil-DNA glycosylase
MSEPFQFTSGPHDAQVVAVGEAHGEHEDRYGVPFAGQSGREFFRMLGEAWSSQEAIEIANIREDRIWLAKRDEWLEEHSVLLTNVFALRPQGNNLGALCASKGELPADYALPHVRTENPRYVRTEFLPHLQRLESEIRRSAPNLVLTLGGTATWALCSTSAIGSVRGAVALSRIPSVVGLAPARIPSDGEREGDFKVLPCYHPAAVLRQWSWRPIVLADLLKGRREREFPEIRRPARTVISDPTISEVESWTAETLMAGRYRLLSPDIETMNGQIRCIGFARSASESLVIPFIRDLSGASYWTTQDEEMRAWYCVKRLLESPIPKLGQNFLFDLQYLARMGLHVNNVLHDTMLLHHTLFPELQKGLGFLASIYCNEMAHKLLRKRGEEELKRDE